MSDKELQEALEYNRNYMEAQLSEELFCGDYISAVELEALEKDYDKLQQENKELREKIKDNYCNRTDCSSRIKNSKKYDSLQQRINKAIEYINNNYDGSSYTDDTLKYKVAELNITDLLKILEGDK